MNFHIQQYADETFKDDSTFLHVETALNLEEEPLILHAILKHLDLSETSWDIDDFDVDGYKHYDEDSNSYWVGMLLIDSSNKNKNDFLELAVAWEKAEKRI